MGVFRAIMVLTGFRHREIYPESFERRRNVSVEELQRLATQVVTHETNIVRHQLESNGVELNCSALNPENLQFACFCAILQKIFC